jgi:hypothetical protein
MTKNFEAEHATLIREFNQYLFDHPDFADEIPQGAIIVLQLAQDKEYNEWSRRLAEANREPGQPLVYVDIHALAPERSRLVNPRLRLVG